MPRLPKSKRMRNLASIFPSLSITGWIVLKHFTSIVRFPFKFKQYIYSFILSMRLSALSYLKGEDFYNISRFLCNLHLNPEESSNMFMNNLAFLTHP